MFDVGKQLVAPVEEYTSHACSAEQPHCGTVSQMPDTGAVHAGCPAVPPDPDASSPVRSKSVSITTTHADKAPLAATSSEAVPR
jgi:hypothetical protein